MVFACAVFFQLVSSAEEEILDNYKVWCQGVCDRDFIPTSTQPGVVLMGGGTDTDEAFVWQISHAGGGDFVVLRTSGDDAYISLIFPRPRSCHDDYLLTNTLEK